MIAVNGRIVAQGTQYSLTDVEVVTATSTLRTFELIVHVLVGATRPPPANATTGWSWDLLFPVEFLKSARRIW